jgi:hypothetical protein
MNVSKLKLLTVHLTGYFHVFLHVLVAAMLMGWALQLLATMHGEAYNWTGVFMHLFLSMSFLAFFPGQQVWTYRLKDADGVVHTIVGRPADGDTRYD